MGRYVGSFYTDNTQDNRRDPAAWQQPGYVPLVNPASTVVDLAARFAAPAALVKDLGLGSADVEVRVNNLLDRVYTAFAYTGDDGAPAFIPAAGRNVFVGLTLGL